MSRLVPDRRGSSLMAFLSSLLNDHHNQRTALPHRNKESHVICLNSIVDTLKNINKNRKLVLTEFNPVF